MYNKIPHPSEGKYNIHTSPENREKELPLEKAFILKEFPECFYVR